MIDQTDHTATIRFLHHVGRSTITQGLTVPVSAQREWLACIRRGQFVPVEIRFGVGQSVPATLRRIANPRGHLQFRYEAKQQAPLRDYLASAFAATCEPESGLLEVVELQPRVFVFRPYVSGTQTRPHLALYQPQAHNLSPSQVTAIPQLPEIGDCLAAVPYHASKGQAQYNASIGEQLAAAGWRPEARVAPGIGLRCDFEKSGAWLEVEFGNARGYYQDYIKFLLAMRHQGGSCGILLAPTAAFASLLCELGRQRAAAKRGNSQRLPRYSGMMSYEKALTELPLLEFMLTGPIVIAGIDIAAQPG